MMAACLPESSSEDIQSSQDHRAGLLDKRTGEGHSLFQKVWRRKQWACTSQPLLDLLHF